MKITIDTENKTIQLHNDITVSELLLRLDMMGRDDIGDISKYKIIPNVIINNLPSHMNLTNPFEPKIWYSDVDTGDVKCKCLGNCNSKNNKQ
jgi:hypothetical protein